jgi:hypothetical protein
MIGPKVSIPIYRTAAVRAEMEVYLPPFLTVPSIKFFGAFYSELRLLKVYA